MYRTFNTSSISTIPFHHYNNQWHYYTCYLFITHRTQCNLPHFLITLAPQVLFSSNTFMGKILSCFWAFVLLAGAAISQPSNQPLKSGFNRHEYADLLWLQFHALSDSLANRPMHELEMGNYQKIYSTKEVGLANKAAIFLRQDNVVVLELRGTVNQTTSWLENFYAGMVPAKGLLKLADDFTFDYQVAADAKAAVHIGWLIGTAFLSRAYLPTLDSLVAAGHTNIVVSGHSQGGALSFLTTSYLHYYYKANNKPVQLKTYASAAPKPGNLYYAYDFESITANGMGFRVVNTADWVPETPFSLQTLQDYNEVNPFLNLDAMLGQQKMAVRLYLKNLYKKLDRSTTKSAEKFRKYLGEKLYNQVAKELPGFAKPALHPSMNYSTAGIPIVLTPNETYAQQFVFTGKNVFVHHMLAPYSFLLNLHYPASKN